MLIAKTKTGPDAFGGTGLFAAEDIKKGDIVWRFSPLSTKLITVEQYFGLSQAEKNNLERYGYPCFALGEDPAIIGVFIDNDDSKFVNHSETPTLGYDENDSDVNIAARDIKKGEELTCDYWEFDPENVLALLGVKTCKTFLLERGKKKNVA